VKCFIGANTLVVNYAILLIPHLFRLTSIAISNINVQYAVSRPQCRNDW